MVRAQRQRALEAQDEGSALLDRFDSLPFERFTSSQGEVVVVLLRQDQIGSQVKYSGERLRSVK